GRTRPGSEAKPSDVERRADASRRCNHEPASGGEDGRDLGARRSRATWSAEPTRAGGATMSRRAEAREGAAGGRGGAEGRGGAGGWRGYNGRLCGGEDGRDRGARLFRGRRRHARLGSDGSSDGCCAEVRTDATWERGAAERRGAPSRREPAVQR